MKGKIAEHNSFALSTIWLWFVCVWANETQSETVHINLIAANVCTRNWIASHSMLYLNSYIASAIDLSGTSEAREPRKVSSSSPAWNYDMVWMLSFFFASFYNRPFVGLSSLNWFNLTNFWPKANANQLRFYDSPLEMLSRLKRTAISHIPSLFVLFQVALKKWKHSKEKVRAFSILPNEKLPVSLSIFINPSIFKQFR